MGFAYIGIEFDDLILLLKVARVAIKYVLCTPISELLNDLDLSDDELKRLYKVVNGYLIE